MHIHAQTKVDQMTTRFKKQRGHDQHAAITNTITTFITTSSPRLDLGVCGSGRGLGPGLPGPALGRLRPGSKALEARTHEDTRFGGLGSTKTRENTWFCGLVRMKLRENTWF